MTEAALVRPPLNPIAAMRRAYTGLTIGAISLAWLVNDAIRGRAMTTEANFVLTDGYLREVDKAEVSEMMASYGLTASLATLMCAGLLALVPHRFRRYVDAAWAVSSVVMIVASISILNHDRTLQVHDSNLRLLPIAFLAIGGLTLSITGLRSARQPKPSAPE